MLWGVIHSTKISGNFGLKPNGSVRSNRKSFEKTGPPFKVVLFSRSDWYDRKMTAPFDHSDSFSCPVLTVTSLMLTTRKMAAPPASVYRCSFCHNFCDSLENLLSHECNTITGKCLVNLFVVFAKKIIQELSQSVFASRLAATIPAKTNSSEDVDISASDFIVLFFE